jgi:hypothetical protein
MINLDVDTAKITKLKTKFAKYGPYAIKMGLKSANDFLNTPTFKRSMYPPSQSGQPFVWSSDKQRRFVFANIRLPSVRSFALADAGMFTINESSFWIAYTNSAPYSQFVIHPSYQIIGHRTRGWKPVNQFVVKEAPKIVRDFKASAIKAWDEMDAFMYGGGAGL